MSVWRLVNDVGVSRRHSIYLSHLFLSLHLLIPGGVHGVHHPLDGEIGDSSKYGETEEQANDLIPAQRTGDVFSRNLPQHHHQTTGSTGCRPTTVTHQDVLFITQTRYTGDPVFDWLIHKYIYRVHRWSPAAHFDWRLEFWWRRSKSFYCRFGSKPREPLTAQLNCPSFKLSLGRSVIQWLRFGLRLRTGWAEDRLSMIPDWGAAPAETLLSKW